MKQEYKKILEAKQEHEQTLRYREEVAEIPALKARIFRYQQKKHYLDLIEQRQRHTNRIKSPHSRELGDERYSRNFERFGHSSEIDCTWAQRENYLPEMWRRKDAGDVPFGDN